MERVGVLTGGGDCPGLNAVIRGVVRKAFQEDIKIIGIKNGWKGMIECDYAELDFKAIAASFLKAARYLAPQGLILTTKPGDVEKAVDTYKKLHARRPDSYRG